MIDEPCIGQIILEGLFKEISHQATDKFIIPSSQEYTFATSMVIEDIGFLIDALLDECDDVIFDMVSLAPFHIGLVGLVLYQMIAGMPVFDDADGPIERHLAGYMVYGMIIIKGIQEINEPLLEPIIGQWFLKEIRNDGQYKVMILLPEKYTVIVVFVFV